MSEMVERAAIAIWNSRESRFPGRVQRQPDDLDRSSGAWDAVVADARASIGALRVPTPDTPALRLWNAMIDEALKD